MVEGCVLASTRACPGRDPRNSRRFLEPELVFARSMADSFEDQAWRGSFVMTSIYTEA